MSEISKQALKVDNSQSFPDNNAGAITPSDLRAFNVNMIDSLVDEIGYNQDSASWNNSISRLNTFTSSQQPAFNALNQFTASQIVTNTNLNQFTQSATQELDSLSAWTGSWELWTSSINEIRDDGVLQGYSTRFFFNGLVSASIVQNVNGPIANVTIQQDGTKLNTSSFNAYTASTQAAQTAYSASVSASLNQLTQFSASQNAFNISISSSVQELLDLSSSLSGGYATQGELDTVSSSLATTINNNSSSQALLNRTFATTGSNVFTGDQTLIDVAGNTVTLSDISGSLMLVAKGFTSASAHISGSGGNQVNLMFKNNNNTSDTILSGSNNIFVNGAAPSTGFKRYIGNSNYYPHATSVPQISGSMAWSPVMNGNIMSSTMGTPFTFRGPVSSSISNILSNTVMGGTINLGSSAVLNMERAVAGINMSGNALFNSTYNLTANTTTLQNSINVSGNLSFGAGVTLNSFSSSISFNSNVNNGNLTLNNRYSPIGGTNAAALSPRANVNTLYGTGHAINFDGSNVSTTQTKEFSYNIIAGTFLTGSIGDGDSCSIISTGIIGNGLIVTGSTLTSAATGLITATSGQGSMFLGRFNALDGNKAKSAETVFAVGTGTGYTNRKTGFLVDSGSNTFVEGSLNVSGSTNVTGSVYGNIVPLSVVANTASMDLSTSNFFSLTLPTSSTTQLTATNIKPGQTVNLLITQGTPTTGSLSYNTTFKFPAGGNYVATPITGAQDIITFISYDTTKLYSTSINNLG